MEQHENRAPKKRGKKMNENQKSYIKKHNEKIDNEKIDMKRFERATFAKCDNVKWLYINIPSLRARIEREG